MREGVTFQDGTPMDAEAVVGALQHVLDAKTPARSFNPDVVVRRRGRRRLDRCDHHAGSRTCCCRCGLPARTPGSSPRRRTQGEQIDIIGTCTGPFTVIEEVPRQSLAARAQRGLLGRRGRHRDGRGPVRRRRRRPGHPGPDRGGADRGSDPGGLAVDSRGRLQPPGGVDPGASHDGDAAEQLPSAVRRPAGAPGAAARHRHRGDRRQCLRGWCGARRSDRSRRTTRGRPRAPSRSRSTRTEAERVLLRAGRCRPGVAELRADRLQRPAGVRRPGGRDPGPAGPDRDHREDQGR